MRKKIVWLSVAIALSAITIYCIRWFKLYNSARVQDISYENGLADVFKKMNRVNPDLKHKSYYYFNAWNIRCRPCIEEMPQLDSIADKLSPKIGFIYVTDDPEEKASAFLRKRGLSSRNFIYLHDMGDFISAVYHSQGIRYKVFPTHFVTDTAGKLLFFQEGSLSYASFGKGHTMTRQDSILMEKMQDPLITFLKNIR